MQKAATMLAVVGGLIAAGIALSFFGSMIIVEDLVQQTENIGGGSTLEITAELDPEINDEGFYVVQAMQFSEGMISARVIDPFGGQIISKTVESGSYQEQFEIKSGGTFTLIIENAGENSDIIGAIGHVPDSGKVSVGIAGSYLLIAGLIGMVVVGIYAVKNRRKS